jgi:hypothetical protein
VLCSTHHIGEQLQHPKEFRLLFRQNEDAEGFEVERSDLGFRNNGIPIFVENLSFFTSPSY